MSLSFEVEGESSEVEGESSIKVFIFLFTFFQVAGVEVNVGGGIPRPPVLNDTPDNTGQIEPVISIFVVWWGRGMT